MVENLTNIAGGTLRLLLDGHSHKRGKHPEWLEKSIHFELTGLKPGSTILEVKAPALSETIQSVQLPIQFDDIAIEDILAYSAIDLSLNAFNQAFSEDGDTSLLDKSLLKDMQKFKKIIDSGGGSISITGTAKNRTDLNQESFKKIKKMESATSPSIRARLTGTFDLMKHSNSLMELIVNGKKIRAFLTSDLNIHEVKSLFGEEVTVDGIAHFKPNGQINSFEVDKVRLAQASDNYFKRIPAVVTDQLSIAQVAEAQSYYGTDLKKIIGKWPGEEGIDELLNRLD